MDLRFQGPILNATLGLAASFIEENLDKGQRMGSVGRGLDTEALETAGARVLGMSDSSWASPAHQE